MRRKRFWTVGVLLLMIVAGGVALLVHRQSDSTSVGAQLDPAIAAASHTSGTYKTFSAAKGVAYDQLFVVDMATNQQNTAALADVAASRAEHAALRDFASRSVEGAHQRSQSLAAWRQEWGYQAAPAAAADHSTEELSDESAGSAAQLAAQTGGTVDRLFLEQSIELHTVALDIAGPGKTQAGHTEVRQLAGEMTTQQTQELKQLRQWQKEWGYNE
jgi:uncharacterized protein (DUF305 family)